MDFKYGKILIATDKKEDVKIVISSLVAEGYDVFFAASDIFFELVKKHKPFSIIFDIDISEKKWFEICTQLKSHDQFKEILIIILSASNEEDAILKGLETGADLYINKPVSTSLLISKVNALSRRFSHNIKTISEVGDIVVDREKYLVFHKNIPIEFPRKEFELLALLTSRIGKVFLRDEILNLLWNPNVGARTVDVHIHKIRQKLGTDSIKTIKGIGYKI